MIKLQDKIFSFATVTLVSALVLGGIAAWYSIQGLMAIFSASVIPIMIMGAALEAAKVVTTVWLHRYWKRAPWFMKSYMIAAVCFLAFITSMGIFGALSKSHSDQSLASGDVTAAISVYDQKIDTAKQNIDSDRKALSQMDAQVDQILGRSADINGATKAVSIRKQQSTERDTLNKDIETNQTIIAQLNDESAPIRAKVRKAEADVGPIKYIAALIYGDNPNNDLLERAVRWVIIVIVFVFDPLALTLVLAAQSSYEWLEEDYILRQKVETGKSETIGVTTAVKDNSDSVLPVHSLNNPENFSYNIPKYTHWPTWTPSTLLTPKIPENNGEHELPIIKVEEEVTQNVPERIQPVDVEYDESDRGELSEEYIPDADEIFDKLESDEGSLPESSDNTSDTNINNEQDDGNHLSGNLISNSTQHKWFTASKFVATPDHPHINTGFGTTFPISPIKGDVFVRIDFLPNKVFKFDNTQWIEINKDQTSSYLYDNNYLNYLVDKIDSGEYDLDLLSENEKVEIEHYLKNTKA